MPPLKTRWEQVGPILDAALDLDDDARRAYLDHACAGNADLRADVEMYLALDEDEPGDPLAGSLTAFLAPLVEALHEEEPCASDEPREDGVPLQDGSRIGPYRIVRPLGRGGMGTVYLAEREDVGKQVALKCVDAAAIQFEQLRRRLVEERRVLAQLDHPGVARFLDAGATTDGTPYFVMEYASGEPITDYCVRKGLSVRARLGLFLQACEAVQAAHQRLVVHRDLKPSNLLVVEDEAGRPQVKLLDFGIAKLLEESTVEPASRPVEDAPVQEEQAGEASAELTSVGQYLLTPAYAAPEQVRGEAVTTATDVYALGMILYELLTTQRPYHVRGRSLEEIERGVMEAEPPPPSTVEGAERGVEPRRLRGDLDAICLKALEKNPAQRYRSVEALTEDLDAFLSSLPVSARAGTPLYRSRKFVRRHWKGLAVTAAVMIVLMATAAVAVRQAQVAGQEASRAEEVKQFLIGLFEDADPYVREEQALTAAELVDLGARRVEAQLAGRPGLQAELMQVVGKLYHSLGRYDDAAPFLESALALRTSEFGANHTQVAGSLYDLGLLCVYQGDYDCSDSLFTAALEVRRQLLGDEHEGVAEALDGMGMVANGRGKYDEAEQFHRKALELRRRAPEEGVSGQEATAETLTNLAGALVRQGDYAEAERLHREALELRRGVLGEEHPEVAESLDNVAGALYGQSEYAEAETLHRDALALYRKIFGSEHPHVAEGLNNLANALIWQGKYVEAERALRASLQLKRKLLHEEHPRIAESLNSLGGVLFKQGRYAEAERHHREGLRRVREALGEEHPNVAVHMNNLAMVLHGQGKYAEAETLQRNVLAISQRVFGDEHRYVALGLNNLANTVSLQGRYAEAEQLLRDALALYQNALGGDRPEVPLLLNNLAMALQDQDEYAEAERLLRDALARYRAAFGPKHPEVAKSTGNLARALYEQGKHADAERLFREALALRKELLGVEHPDVATNLIDLGDVLLARNEAEVALPLFQEGLKIRKQALPADHPDLADAHRHIGMALLQRSQFEEAEEHLLEAWSLLQEREDDPQECLESLVELYEAWKKPEMVSKYRASLDEARSSS